MKQLCTFIVGDLMLGVDVCHVQEILRWQELTRVPLAAPIVRGLVNLRGQVVSALDVRVRLGMAASQTGMNVVVKTSDTFASLLVDDIGDVIDVAQDRFEESPPTLAPALRELAIGIYKLDTSLITVIDVDRIEAA